MMWSKDEGDLADRSYNSMRMRAQEVRMALHMQCSDKNVIIPEGVPASIVQRALLEEGGKVNIMNHGVDMGTDVTAGKRRSVTKLKEREQTGRKKAKSVSVLSRIDPRYKTMGKTGVMPTSTYGVDTPCDHSSISDYSSCINNFV